MRSLEIRLIEDSSDPDVVALAAESDAYLNSLYPPESNHAESIETLMKADAAFFGGYIDEELVACGAAKILGDDGIYGEIKRVFVVERQRGKNLATALMEHIEDYLRSNGIGVVRLETGPRQPEALEFYRRRGYVERGPFGKYGLDPLSVFMEKALRE